MLDNERDFDAPPMSPISEGFNEGDMNSGNNDTIALPHSCYCVY